MNDKSEQPAPQPTDDAAAEAARFLEDHRQVESVDLLVSDINGVMRGKSAPPKTLLKAAREGINLPLSVFGLDIWGREVAGTGLHIESGDRDGYCRAVPGRIASMPWTGDTSAQALLSMYDEHGNPFECDPRQALAGLLARFAERGLRPVTAVELEFYLVEEDAFLRDGRLARLTPPGPVAQEMYAVSAIDGSDGLFAEIRAHAGVQDLPVDTIVKEAAPGQFEVNLNHREDALAAADDAVLLKRLIAETARRHGKRATFMAKPFADWPGNGMHIHASLIDEKGANIFAGDNGDALLGQAAAGMLAHMADCALVFIPTVNGFRRLQPGSYAPTGVAWGTNNRSVAVRVPASAPAVRRLEHRLASADANPHLAMTAVLGAMLDGLEREMQPPEMASGNAYESDLPGLPATMRDTLAAFERSGFARALLGDRLHHVLVEVKRAEIDSFDSEITPLERSTYL